jgi:hypothetical protein
MSSSSNGTSFALKIGVEDIVADSRPTGCLCNLRIKKKKKGVVTIYEIKRLDKKRELDKVDELMKVVMLIEIRWR